MSEMSSAPPAKRARAPATTTTTTTTAAGISPPSPSLPRWSSFSKFLESVPVEGVFEAVDVVEACKVGLEEAKALVQRAADLHLISIVHASGSYAASFQKNSKERVNAYRVLEGDVESRAYELLVQSGQEGLSLATLKKKMTPFKASTVDSLVKALEKKGLIKKFNNMLKKNIKHYIIATLTPSRELSGAPWYTETGVFDTVFVENVRTTTLQVVERLQYEAGNRNGLGVPAERIHAELKAVLKVDPTRLQDFQVTDLEKILDELFHTGEMLRTARDDEARYVRLRTPVHPSYTAVPCLVCPYREQCGPSLEHKYNPIECEYMDGFLRDDGQALVDAGKAKKNAAADAAAAGLGEG